jgi:hypothetical protein
MPDFQSLSVQREAALRLAKEALDDTGATLSRGRGALALAILGLGGWGATQGLSTIGWAVEGALVAAFAGLVARHARVASNRAEAEERHAIVRARLERMGSVEPASELPARAKKRDRSGARFASATHAYSGDLDLFGPSSLFVAVSRAETPVGEATLARWLSEPADCNEIAARQEAARELAADPVLLEDLAFLGRSARAAEGDEEPLAAWGAAPRELPLGEGDPPGVADKRWIVAVLRVLVPSTLALLALRGVLSAVHPWLGYAWVASVAVQLALFGRVGEVARGIVVRVSSREAPFGRHRRLLARIEAMDPRSAMLVRLRDALASGPEPASRGLERLERALTFADLRHNTLIHLVVSAFAAYDLWVALALERWRRDHGAQLGRWFSAVGELEALASVASYSAEHPDFAWPEVTDGPAHLEAEGLGHPLLPASERVTNVADLDAPGRALLVTGSNMSGKSTYLRALGLCAVMACAGLPVCARRARLSRLATWTSMRIGDALERKTSHFYAEITRLKDVVDATGEPARAPVLFLLDEILHGTNSHERTLGARAVVRTLVRRGAIGAVSTHDFALVAIAEESEGRVRLVHFADRVEEGRMRFDYERKDGLAKTTNALRLMRLVGIPMPDGLDAERPDAGGTTTPA